MDRLPMSTPPPPPPDASFCADGMACATRGGRQRGAGVQTQRRGRSCARACVPEGSLGSSQTKRARRRAGRGRTASSVYAAIPWTGMPGRRSGRRAPSAGPAASPALLGSCGRLGDLKAMPLARAVCARGGVRVFKLCVPVQSGKLKPAFQEFSRELRESDSSQLYLRVGGGSSPRRRRKVSQANS